MSTQSSEQYYWNLTLRDGRVIKIPPTAVELVKRKMNNREPIHTSDGSIPFAQIDDFSRSSKKVDDPASPERLAQAFGEPLLSDDGMSVVARWMKKEVSNVEYDKKYAKSSSYIALGRDGGMVTVAFVIPVHMINKQYMVECTPQEITYLEKNRY